VLSRFSTLNFFKFFTTFVAAVVVLRSSAVCNRLINGWPWRLRHAKCAHSSLSLGNFFTPKALPASIAGSRIDSEELSVFGVHGGVGSASDRNLAQQIHELS